jgi:Fe2+ or Zn2+ uptake regulation protein
MGFMDGVNKLKKCKIKNTKARAAIIGILDRSIISLDAEEIYRKCAEKGVEINFSTVYRTLDLFEEKGIVEKFDLGNGKYSFVLRREAHKHLLQCRLCRKEVEIDCPMQQVEELIRNRTGFSSIEHELKIEGICEECKTRRK